MKINILTFIFSIILFGKLTAQIGINATNTPPATNAMLDVSSTTKGLLIPRMTTAQRNALVVSEGLTVYDTDTKGYWFHNGTAWQNLSTVAGNTPWLTTGNDIYNANTNNVGIGTTTPTYKLDIAHPGATGIRVRSSDTFSVIDIDAFSGDAAIRFMNNGVNKWNVRNQPGTDNFQIFDLSGGGEKFSIIQATKAVRIEGQLSAGTNNDALSLGGFGSFSIDAPNILGGRFRILENGNIGIGDNGPTSKLSITGNIKINDGTAATGKVLTAIDGSGLASWQNIGNFWSANGNNISNSNSGNVGVGTSTPLSYYSTGRALNIHQAANAYDIGPNLVLSYDSQGTNYGNIGNITFAQSNATSTDKRIGVIATNLDTNGGYGSLANPKGHMDFYTNNGSGIAMGMMLSSQGKLGLGGFVIPPAFPLTFQTALGDKISLYGNTIDAPHYGFGIQGGLLQIHSDAVGADIAFGYGHSGALTETMRIKGIGKVEIKSTNQESLWINGPNGNYITLAESGVNRGYIGSYAGADQDIELGTHTANTTGSVHLTTANTPRLTVRPDGNVGINNTNPTVPLTVGSGFGTRLSLYQGATGHVGFGVYGGELRAQVDIPGGKVSLGALDGAGVYFENAFSQRNGAFAFSILGSLWVNGTTYASDRRFKKNIKPYGNSLTKLTQLQGVSYEMNTETFKQNNFKTTNDIGLIAQDVQKIFPEVVSQKDGYLGIDYGKLVPVLIEAIKEQQKQIEELRAIVKVMNK